MSIFLAFLNRADNSFDQQKSETQKSSDFLVSLRVFNGILAWLAGLIQLTEEEQSEAGIYLGNKND